MGEFYSNFKGYLQVNMHRINWILMLGLIFYVLYCLLWLKGYTKKYKNVLTSMMCGIILSLNCSFVFVMTLWGRRIQQSYDVVLKPFQSYQLAIAEGNMEILLQILVNIVMYIPMGIVLPCCFKRFEKGRNIIFVSAIISLCIELIQCVFKLGLFEIDDIINNILGCMIGVCVRKICRKRINLKKLRMKDKI